MSLDLKVCRQQTCLSITLGNKMFKLHLFGMVAICFFIIGFFLGKYKKKYKERTCSYIDRPIIEGDRKDYNPPPTAPKPKEYRGRIGGDRKDYNSQPTSPKPDFLKPHLPLSSGLWGRKDRKDEPLGPKPTTRPWAQ